MWSARHRLGLAGKWAVMTFTAAVTLTSLTHAQDLVSLTLEGDSAAAASQRWRVFRRGSTWVAERRVDHGPEFGSRDVVGLMADDDQRALMETLRPLDVFSLKATSHRPGPLPRARWTLVLEAPDRPRYAVTFEAPEQLDDRRFVRVVRAVMTAVESVTPPMPLRDLQAPLARSGWLHLEAPAGARVKVDGVGLHETTPIDALRLETGQHVIEVAFPPFEAVTSYDVRIEQGKATLLRVTAP